MSHLLYSTRLYWAGMRGIAKLHGDEVKLQAPPHLPGMQIDGIDYVPEIALHQVMPKHERWRDMTPAEVQQADVLLRTLTRTEHP